VTFTSFSSPLGEQLDERQFGCTAESHGLRATNLLLLLLGLLPAERFPVGFVVQLCKF